MRKSQWILFSVFLLFFVGAAQGQNYRVLYSFGPGSDGRQPANVVLTPSARLYGATSSGGNFDQGSIFSLDLEGNETVLHSFNSATDGAYPLAGLLITDEGAVYGTASMGGDYNHGTVFKLDTVGNFTVLHHFGSIPNDGGYPESTLVRDAVGNLYGTTAEGGASTYRVGTVFRLDTALNETILHSFNWTDGAIPREGVWLDDSGNLYGTTEYGGSQNSDGVVYKIDRLAEFTLLHKLNGDPDGSEPWSRLVGDPVGNLYGTASEGGPYGVGVVFTIDPAGNETVKHAFTRTNGDGVIPHATLLMDSTKNLYGSTAGGGANGFGVLFKIDPDGNEVILHSFSGQQAGDGDFPGNLTSDAAGDIFGVTNNGGIYGRGTVFEYSAAPSSAIPSMVTYVNSLYLQGKINGGHNNSLTKQLQQASKLIDAGKQSGAIGSLKLFASEVNGMFASGALTRTQAADLIFGVNSLIRTVMTP